MKKTTATNPKLSVQVSPVASSFEVSIPGSDKIFGLEEYFKFSVAYDGTVTLNDNEFSSKKQAAQALEAMAAFLRK
jgi:hypothetical protein